MNDGKMEKIIEKERRRMGFKKAKINVFPYTEFKTSEEWMAKLKSPSEIKIERDETDNKLKKLIEQEASQTECPSLSDCKYIREIIDLGYISLKQANNYFVLICEKYPGACKLNKF
jgi:hypothetical protein